MFTENMTLSELREFVDNHPCIGSGMSRVVYEVNDFVYKVPCLLTRWARGKLEENELGVFGPKLYEESDQSHTELEVWNLVKDTEYARYFTPILGVVYVENCTEPIIVMPLEKVLVDEVYDECGAMSASFSDYGFIEAVFELTQDEDVLVFGEVMLDTLYIEDLHEYNMVYDSSANFSFRLLDYGFGDSGRISDVVADKA